jgi:hypothetical protein
MFNILGQTKLHVLLLLHGIELMFYCGIKISSVRLNEVNEHILLREYAYEREEMQTRQLNTHASTNVRLICALLSHT